MDYLIILLLAGFFFWGGEEEEGCVCEHLNYISNL